MVKECVVLCYKIQNPLAPRILSSSYATMLADDLELLDKQKAEAYLHRVIDPTAVVEDAFDAKLYKVWQYSANIGFWPTTSHKRISKNKQKLAVVTYRNNAGRNMALNLKGGVLFQIPNSTHTKTDTTFINTVWGQSLELYKWNSFHCRLWAYVDADLENPDEKARVLFDHELCQGATELEYELRNIRDSDFSTVR